MNKKLIRLTESDLHRIVKESVNKILNEDFEPYNYGNSPKILIFSEGSKDLGSILVSDEVARYFYRCFKAKPGISIGYRPAKKEDLSDYADVRNSFLDTPMY